ncbi:MAG: gamma-glutamyl-gamma-aminobutyrate hydrolase family protein [Verrucomicrobiota bacterium]|jgi:putative glutamine amidotransferase
MTSRPAILVTPSTERKGAEFADFSISLSNRYTDAVIDAGGLPQVFPATTSKTVISEALDRCDGVLMTGGDDIDPRLYATDLPDALAKTVGPLEPERDLWETELIAQVLKRHKPLFGICRGHQMLNVALGGTLVVDIASLLPNALNHRRMDRKMEPVHDVSIAPDSLLGKITGLRSLAVNSTHHQAIGLLADPLRAVAQSPDGIIEAVELKQPDGMPFLLAVQFHPERLIDSNPVFLRLFTSFIDACGRRRP